jgi:alanyl-tRNA synthetase
VIALTGPKAKSHRQQTRDVLQQTAVRLGAAVDQVPAAAADLMTTVRQLKKELSAGKVSEYVAEPETKTDGADALEIPYTQARNLLRDAARSLNVTPFDVPQRIESLQADRERLVEELKQVAAGGKVSAEDLLEQAEQVGQAMLVVIETPGANPNLMRGWIDQLRKKSDGPLAVLLAAVQGEKVLLVGGLTKDLVGQGLHAGNWVGAAAKQLGGGGGGRPDLAQAGGRHPEKLTEALETARQSMKEQLAG